MDNGRWTMDDGQWTMDNGQWTMDNGRWTMDRDYVAPFRANPNIADPSDPTDPTDQSEKATDQITNSRAISSVKATTPYKNFRVFSCGSWLKTFLDGGYRKPAKIIRQFSVSSMSLSDMETTAPMPRGIFLTFSKALTSSLRMIAAFLNSTGW
jgi:hypothetical protein